MTRARPIRASECACQSCCPRCADGAVAPGWQWRRRAGFWSRQRALCGRMLLCARGAIRPVGVAAGGRGQAHRRRGGRRCCQ
eukprot:2166989-Lingulodinium_polyedra.AAC.1